MTTVDVKIESKELDSKLAELRNLIARAEKVCAGGCSAGRVIVRTQNAGVHFGTLVKREGGEVTLDGARRIWRWYGANTCSEIALTGIDSKQSRVARPVDGHVILGVIEVLPCSDAAAKTIEAAKWAP